MSELELRLRLSLLHAELCRLADETDQIFPLLATVARRAAAMLAFVKADR
jgi:hypothetical protein